MWLIIKNLLFTLIAPGTVAGLIPYLLLRSELPELHVELGAVRYLGWLFVALGVAIYAWTVWEFATTGRGTPAPIDAPKVLIVRGLHRYVRNPMYLGVLSVILGWAVLSESALIVLYDALAWIVVHTFVIIYEEPTLARLFGDQYAEYRRTVPRWMPNLKRRQIATLPGYDIREVRRGRNIPDQTRWYPLKQKGFTVGDRGSEQGIIVRDEEYSEGARVTLERDCWHNIPFAITCGIYGFSAHTCFFSDERSANEGFETIKLQLAEIMDMWPEDGDPNYAQKYDSALAAWEQFVYRW